jgi:exodeoxyribonuclease VII small subunit
MKKTQTFEKAMKRLEEIGQSLDTGDIALEESIKLYEEGIELIDFCKKKLDEAEKKVKKLSRNSDGEFNISSLDGTLSEENN